MQSILRSKASSTAEINNIGKSKIVNLVSECFTTKYPRMSKSATYARKNTVRNASDQQQNMEEIINIYFTKYFTKSKISIILASIIASD